MKKLIFVGILGLFVLGSCNNSTVTHTHDEHDHAAEGHNHEAEEQPATSYHCSPVFYILCAGYADSELQLGSDVHLPLLVPDSHHPRLAFHRPFTRRLLSSSSFFMPYYN